MCIRDSPFSENFSVEKLDLLISKAYASVFSTSFLKELNLCITLKNERLSSFKKEVENTEAYEMCIRDRLAIERGVDIIFVDYLQLMHGNSKESRTLEVGEISQGLKNIAKELDIPVVGISQLSRAIEQRQSRRPQLSDLRESGSIEQDADVVMFVDREEAWNPDTEEKGLGELIVAKHRNCLLYTSRCV